MNIFNSYFISVPSVCRLLPTLTFHLFCHVIFNLSYHIARTQMRLVQVKWYFLKHYSGKWQNIPFYSFPLKIGKSKSSSYTICPLVAMTLLVVVVAMKFLCEWLQNLKRVVWPSPELLLPERIRQTNQKQEQISMILSDVSSNIIDKCDAEQIFILAIDPSSMTVKFAWKLSLLFTYFLLKPESLHHAFISTMAGILHIFPLSCYDIACCCCGN